MKYDIIKTGRFKRDFTKVEKQGYDMTLLKNIIRKLANGIPLPNKYCDHALNGEWIGARECHVLPNWLLIYRIDNGCLALILSRTGSHSDLLKK